MSMTQVQTLGRRKAPMPTSRYSTSGTVINGKLYIFGGFDIAGNFFNTVEVYDPAGDSWTTESSMPTSRWGSANAAVNGIAYVVGGGNNTNSYLKTVEAFTAAPVISIQMYPGITINAPVGSTNQIQYITSLNNANWTTLTNLVLPSSPYIFIDYSSPGQPQRFYRDVLQ